ncbi:MAG: hypothetical protein RTU09_04630 [Candidatus Thorarchaeota archaeon]
MAELRFLTMNAIEEIRTHTSRVVVRFTNYLNGPLGRSVLDNLDEGESFILQTSDHTMRITKRNGKAVVTLVSAPAA